jgi:hypothetical protein
MATVAIMTQDQGAMGVALLVALVGGVAVIMRPELGALALTATFFLGYVSVLEGEGRFTLNNLLGLLLLGILVARAFSERDASLLFDRHLLLVGLIASLIVANQIMTAGFTPPAELAALDLSEARVQGIVSKLAYLLFLIAFIRTRSQVLLLACAVVAFVLMTAPNAIWNALAASDSNVEKIRAYADFGIRAARNANRLAFVCALAIAIIGFAMRSLRSWPLRLLGAAGIVLLVMAIFLSASRSGLLNLIVLTVVFAAKSLRPRVFVILVLVGLLVGMGGAFTYSQGPAQAILEPGEVVHELFITAGSVVIPTQYLERITSLGARRGAEGHGSTSARLGLLAVGWNIFLDHPLTGIGVGNFRWVSIADYQADRISALHNSYLLTLVEGGLLLFIPYLLLYAYLWRSLGRTRRLAAVHPEVGLGWLVEAMQVILVMFLVFSAFADLWHDIYPFLIAGFAASLAGIYRRAEEGSPA